MDVEYRVRFALAQLMADVQPGAPSNGLPPLWKGIVHRVAALPIEKRLSALGNELTSLGGFDANDFVAQVLAVDLSRPPEPEVMTAALGYLARGWSVVPVLSGEKRPACKWQDYQTNAPTEDQLRRWFDPARGGQYTNLAVVLGRVSGHLAVRDFDDGDAYDDWADAHPEYACELSTVKTARGCHVYLMLPADSPIRGIIKLSDGEFRTDGGIVVAPPSHHPSGIQYEWIVPLPAGNLPEIDPAEIGLTGVPQLRPVQDASATIAEGMRNSTLTSFAGSLRRKGFSEEAIHAALDVQNRQGCHPPLDDLEVVRIAKSVARYPTADSSILVSEHRTDLGNARRLIARHGGDLRYVHHWKKWLWWDDRRWKIDDSGETMRLAKETIGSLYAEAADCHDGDRQDLAKWAIRSEAEQRLQAMISLAQSEPNVPVAPDQLDRDKWLLNCENGTLDLRGRELRSHDRSDLITKIVSAPYEPEATSGLWISFLERIFDRNSELIAFVQRAAGYALTGETYEHCLFILHGTGRNGKSTLLEALAALLNDYAQQTPTETLLASPGNRIPNDVAQLKGARLVTAVEVEEGRRLNETLVKQLTGGDRLAARFLYGEIFQYIPQCKLLLAVNHRPEIRGTDNAIWERIKLIPFDVTIPARERDKKLPEKLRAELSGILAWAVEGCRAWQLGGLGDPREVVGATQAYRDEMDVLGAFIAARCSVSPDARCPSSKIFKAYTDWCISANEKALRQKDFVARLGERGFKKEKRNVMVWSGIGLLDEVEA